MGNRSDGLGLHHALWFSLVFSPFNIAGELFCPLTGCYWALGYYFSLDAVGWVPPWLAHFRGFFATCCCTLLLDGDLVGWSVLASYFSFSADTDLLRRFAPDRISCHSLLSPRAVGLKVFRQSCTACPDSWQRSGSTRNGRQDSAASGDAVQDCRIFAFCG